MPLCLSLITAKRSEDSCGISYSSLEEKNCHKRTRERIKNRAKGGIMLIYVKLKLTVVIIIQIMFFYFLITQISYAQGNWRRIGDMPERRYGHTVDEINGKIYVIGGAIDENSSYPAYSLVYDRQTSEWSNFFNYNNSIRGAHMSCVVDGNLYIVGGNNGVKTIATMEVYKPDSGKWVSKPEMPTDRGLGAAAVIDGKIYVIGGIRGMLPWSLDWYGINTVEIYDIKNNTWSQAADMPTKRWGHTAIAAGGKIYVFGGRTWPDGYSSIYGTVELYDPQTNTWETKSAKMPTARYCLTSCLLDDNIFVIGGWHHSDTGPMYDKVEVYDFKKDEWKTENPLPAKLAVLDCMERDGKIYIYGGARTTHPIIGTSTIYEYSNKDIFAYQHCLGKCFSRLNIDTIPFRTAFMNPYNHNFTAHLIISNSENSHTDSVILLDDGFHANLLSGDGIYGNYILPFSAEDFFTLGVSTFDNQTDKYYFCPDLGRLTTAGPVVLDSISFIYKTGWFYVKPFLRNTGKETIKSAGVKVLCNDPWVNSVGGSIFQLPDLEPGITTSGTWTAISYSDSVFEGFFNIKVNIYSDEYPYWTDSAKKVITDVRRDGNSTNHFELTQNYPNPFNPATKITYSLPLSALVVLKVYDVLGNEITTLVNDEKSAGSYELEWNAERFSSGVYFYQLKAGGLIQAKKMIFSK